MNKKRKLLVLLIVFVLTWVVFRIHAYCTFEEQVGGYLQNYVEAGTVEYAQENLDLAIKSLEKRGMTRGNTDMFYNNPNNDVGLWYKNLVECNETLKNQPDYEILEQQRKGLKGGGDGVAMPFGIDIFPYNTFSFCWALLSVVCTIIFCFVGMDK